MSKVYVEVAKMRTSFVCAGLLLLGVGTAVAGDFPKVETAPGFMYIHNTPIAGGPGVDCVGGGGTIAVNVTSAIGLAADLGVCRAVDTRLPALQSGAVKATESTFLFGPRFTFRNSSRIRPFVEISGGVVKAKLKCDNGNIGNNCNTTTATSLPVRPGLQNPFDTSVSVNAPAFSIGGGLDIKVSKKIAFRFFQAEYLYTAFGNDCRLNVCNTGTNNSQNSFRLKSGLVMGWGGQ